MKTFYYIVGEGKGAPTIKHETQKYACNEAERLAKLNPNVNYYVLKCIFCVKGEVNVKTEFAL